MIAKFASKIGRITAAVGMPNVAKVEKEEKEKGAKESTEEIEIATAIKAITIDEAKDFKKLTPHFTRKHLAFKEIKHGSVTLYQETYQIQVFKDGKFDKVGKVDVGDNFYLAEDKYIVSSRNVAALKKIIDRNKPAALSKVMQAGLKDAGSGNIVSVVVDLKNIPADEKAGAFRTFGGFPNSADIKANADKVQVLTLKMNEPEGKFKLVATLICSDKSSAAAVKTVVGETLAFMKTKANEEPKEKLPAEFDKYITGARTALKAIQLTSAGDKVTASLEVDPETAMHAFTGVFLVVGLSGAKEDPPKKSKAPEKSPNK
jgi:hypothetical protein